MKNLSIQELIKLKDDNQKFNYLFGKNHINKPIYKTKEEAEANMTTLNLDVWTLDENGKKLATKRELKVNSKIASMVSKIFEEIFNNPEQFPINIKEFGAFNWRYAEGKTSPNVFSEHSHGIAIDINYGDNPYFQNGIQKTGRSYKPGTCLYAITADSSVVKIFTKYGWVWGGNFSINKDYMHFQWYEGN